MATPKEIEVILHYHVCPEKHPRHDAPTVREAREFYLREGLIEPITVDGKIHPTVEYGRFITTEKGRKYVEMLCATPFPVTKYIDPREGA